MLSQVYTMSRRHKIALIDPSEHAAQSIAGTITTLIAEIHLASRPRDVQAIQNLLRPLCIGLLEVQDVAAHREHTLQGGH